MKKLLILFLFISFANITNGQIDSLRKTTDYSFIIQDSPSQLFTMRQFNQNYLTGYRLFARGLYDVSKND